MEADDWVTDMQIALETAHVAIADWVPYATYLLCADSADWWCNFKALRAPVLEITWDEFNKAFKKHHIPEGLMERKSEEFCNLTQGKNSVMGYSKEFTHLARNAGDEVNTDAKKRARLHGGLNPKMKYVLNHVKSATFEELVNDALQEEHRCAMYE